MRDAIDAPRDADRIKASGRNSKGPGRIGVGDKDSQNIGQVQTAEANWHPIPVGVLQYAKSARNMARSFQARHFFAPQMRIKASLKPA